MRTTGTDLNNERNRTYRTIFVIQPGDGRTNGTKPTSRNIATKEKFSRQLELERRFEPRELGEQFGLHRRASDTIDPLGRRRPEPSGSTDAIPDSTNVPLNRAITDEQWTPG